MKKNYFSLFLVLSVLWMALSCSKDEDYVAPEIVIPEEPEPEIPVSVDLAAVPYQNLSEYHFFTGQIDSLRPNSRVVPFRPASELFTDYAKKKRFLWMPQGQSAAYVSDIEALDMPVGSVLIKNFYYENTAPSSATRIVETRLMIKKEEGWIFANYIWNAAQTEAALDTNGGTTPITWTDGAGEHTIDYEIPSQDDCLTCHGNEDIGRPIGLKPQNLNTDLIYPGTTSAVNQLGHLTELGLLSGVPGSVISTIDYSDASQDLNLRVRSYFDINCAHCHITGGNASYTVLRFAFNMTADPFYMGVCLHSGLQPPGYAGADVVSPMNIAGSTLPYMMSTDNSFYMMPRIGRTIVHQEAVELVEQWINSLPECD